MIILYVDDFLLIGKDINIKNLKEKLFAEYKMKDLGPAAKYCGFEIQRNRESKTISIKQSLFAKKIVKWIETHAGTIRPSNFPLDTKRKLYPNDKTASPSEIHRYQIAIGNLNHIAINTRPDLAFCTSLLSEFVANPSDEHWEAVIRIYRYIAGTINHGITYGGSNSNIMPEAYADANHGGHITDSPQISPHSFSGNLIVMSGGAIKWSCVRQNRTVAGSFEAEYIALRTMTEECNSMREFYEELGMTVPTITVHEDNESVISTSLEPKHALTKSVNIDYHIVKENIFSKAIDLVFIRTKDQPADSLTKPATGPMIVKFNAIMGVGEC
jgi:hypothetical protein